jgi:hypothetical protein
MASLPQHVIIDSPPELRALAASTGNPHMPSVDMTAFYQTLYDTIVTRDIFYQEALYRLATQMAHGDYLFGINTLSQLERDQLELLICQAGHAISRQMNQLKLYHPTGELLYHFREYRNDSTLVFHLASTFHR